MKFLHHILVALVLIVGAAPAVAQYQVQENAVPLGRGAGKTGFAAAPAGASGTTLAGNTSVAPSFQNAATVLNLACTLAPTACISVFGYVSPKWYGAACDGVTNDTVAFRSAIVAANRKVLSLPSGATCVVQYFEICSNPVCQTGRAGASVPILIEGNGVTLLAPASTAGAATFVYVEQQTATNVPNFVIRNIIIDAGNYANRGLTVFGCLYCTFSNISESRAQLIGCDFTAAVGYVFANSIVEAVKCNLNNTNSGSTGIGVREITTATWLGSADCTQFPQNAGITFTSVHALNNGSIGWIIDCANNTHINPDIEMNLGYGLSATHIAASEWIGSQFSSNNNARGAAGTGGDASVLNNDASPGLTFIGGFSDGSFTNVSGANGNTRAIPGQVGYGYVANCGGSGHYCQTLP